MTAWNEAMDNTLRESVLSNYFNFTLISLQLSTARHPISPEACRKRWTHLHKQRLITPPEPPRKHVLDISEVDFSKQTSPSIFGGVTTPSCKSQLTQAFNIFRDSLKDTFQKMDDRVAQLLPQVPDIDADDQESDEDAVPLDFRTAMIDNKVVIQAKPLSFKTDQEIMQEDLDVRHNIEIGKSGALQPQNYQAFLSTIKQTSFPQNDTSVTIIQPEVDLEKELRMIDLPCNLNPALNNDLRAPKATVSPKPLILRRNSIDSNSSSGSTPEKKKEQDFSLDSILAAQGTSIDTLLEGEDGLEVPDTQEEKKEVEVKREQQSQEIEKKQEQKREGGRHVEKTIERIRKRSHSRSKTPPKQNGETEVEKKELNYYKTARLRATVAEESDDEDDKFFIESRKNTRESLHLPEEEKRDWDSMKTFDSIYGLNGSEPSAQLKELEAERDEFLATFIVPGQKRPCKPGGSRKSKKEKKAPERANAPEWEEKARLRREMLRAANKEANKQLVFRHESKADEPAEVAADEWRNAF